MRKFTRKNYVRKSLSGFTLIEIMIVVALIAMLATIAVPSYVHARERARMVTCIQNLKVIDNSIQQWAMEAKKESGSPVTSTDIRGYMKELPICPSGGKTFADSYEITVTDAQPTCMRVTTGQYAHKF